MYAVLALSEYKNIIESAIGSSPIMYQKYGQLDVRSALSEISRLNIRCLILQKGIASTSDFCEAVKMFKVIRPKTRIVFIAPGIQPGNYLASYMVSKGVYDIYAPPKNEDYRRIVEQLKLILHKPLATYADAVRWDIELTQQKRTKVTTVPVTTVLVLSASVKAGSTLVSTSLAGRISDYNITPAVVEIPLRPHIFNELGLALLEKRSSTLFYSYPHVIANNEPLKIGCETLSEGVIWLVPDTRLPLLNSWSYTQMLQLLHCTKKAGVLIIDTGSNWQHESVIRLLPTVDVVLVVIDPLPVQLLKAEATLCHMLELKNKGANVFFVANKWCDFISKSDFLKVSQINPLTYIPTLSYKDIYRAGYACSTPYSVLNVKQQITPSLDTIINILLPSAIIMSARKSRKKRFNWRKNS